MLLLGRTIHITPLQFLNKIMDPHYCLNQQIFDDSSSTNRGSLKYHPLHVEPIFFAQVGLSELDLAFKLLPKIEHW